MIFMLLSVDICKEGRGYSGCGSSTLQVSTCTKTKHKQIKKHHHQCDNACIDHTHTDIKKHAALAQMTVDVDV